MDDVIEAVDLYYIIVTELDLGKGRIRLLVSLTRITNNTEKVSALILLCIRLFPEFE